MSKRTAVTGLKEAFAISFLFSCNENYNIPDQKEHSYQSNFLCTTAVFFSNFIEMNVQQSSERLVTQTL
jgi:hypothetical protein